MANRLSADPHRKVILFEAGGRDSSLIVRMPSAFYLPVRHPKLNWGYVTEPEPHLNDRQLLCPRGRVLGGSSSINGMVYVRGNPADFNRWGAMGATGWNFETALPYFKKSQNFCGSENPNVYQGTDGPLTVTQPKLANPLYQTFLSAAEQAGHTLLPDLNSPVQEGFGALPMTVAQGVRASTARAYLAPAKARPNLKVKTHALAAELILENGRAKGVQVIVKGQVNKYYADEIILCGGAINSPQLLMLSGIGPTDVLDQAGVKTKHELTGVGKNLMDHLEVYVQQSCTQPISLYKDLGLIGRGLIGIRWLYNQTGLGATNHFEAGGFIKSTTSLPYPDIQFHFLPAAMQYDGSAKAQGHGYQAHVGPMLSKSRGQISLYDNNPTSHPRIKFNYMSEPEDWQVFRQAIRAAREIFNQPAFDDLRGPEIRPGEAIQSDGALDDFIRAHAESAYHPCGTCKMGTDDAAVVDPQGRVHGVQGLRVVDASIFPHITNGNLNAPTIMVAERMADIFLNPR